MDTEFGPRTGALRRRGFLGRLASLAAGGAAAGVGVAPVGAAAQPQGDAPGWLERLTGKHRQFFDVPNLADGKALGQVKNYLDAYRDALGAKPGEVNAVVGIHGSAVPLVFADAAWERFAFGRREGATDPETKQPLMYNRWVGQIRELQERGTVFTLCNNSLNRNVRTISGEGLGTADEVRAGLMAALLEGVEVVPAHMVAANQAQEAGLSYVYLG